MRTSYSFWLLVVILEKFNINCEWVLRQFCVFAILMQPEWFLKVRRHCDLVPCLFVGFVLFCAHNLYIMQTYRLQKAVSYLLLEEQASQRMKFNFCCWLKLKRWQERETQWIWRGNNGRNDGRPKTDLLCCVWIVPEYLLHIMFIIQDERQRTGYINACV